MPPSPDRANRTSMEIDHRAPVDPPMDVIDLRLGVGLQSGRKRPAKTLAGRDVEHSRAAIAIDQDCNSFPAIGRRQHHRQAVTVGLLPFALVQRRAASPKATRRPSVRRAKAACHPENACPQASARHLWRNEASASTCASSSTSRALPVEPGDFVVLRIGVVVALLGPPELITRRQHDGAARGEKRGKKRALITLTEPRRPSRHCSRLQRRCSRRDSHHGHRGSARHSPHCACARSETGRPGSSRHARR